VGDRLHHHHDLTDDGWRSLVENVGDDRRHRSPAPRRLVSRHLIRGPHPPTSAGTRHCALAAKLTGGHSNVVVIVHYRIAPEKQADTARTVLARHSAIREQEHVAARYKGLRACGEPAKWHRALLTRTASNTIIDLHATSNLLMARPGVPMVGWSGERTVPTDPPTRTAGYGRVGVRRGMRRGATTRAAANSERGRATRRLPRHRTVTIAFDKADTGAGTLAAAYTGQADCRVLPDH
jgi:hypothetical protein